MVRLTGVPDALSGEAIDMPTMEDNQLMSKVPTPVAAALGLLPTVLDGARKLPAKAATLPVVAISTALTALETARKEYDELSDRGERLVNQLRGRPDAPADNAVDNASNNAEAPQAASQEAISSPRVETAATPDVIDLVDVAVELSDAPTVTSHDELPLPDYDHMTLGSLRGRLRTLTIEQLVQVRDYEKAHAHRLPVVTLLDNRIAKLAAG